MRLVWTDEAVSDLLRVRAFLEPVSPEAAARAVQMLAIAPERLLEHPRLGSRVGAVNREVRRLIVGEYELRYEIRSDTLYILRVWHGREHR